MIEHIGLIEKIEKGVVFVRITQQAACSSCEAKGFCTSSEQKEKLIKVELKAAPALFNVGEQVLLIGTTKMAFRSIFLAFILPSLLILATLITGNLQAVGEELSALLGIGTLALYYTILYFFRDALKKQLAFTISKV